MTITDVELRRLLTFLLCRPPMSVFQLVWQHLTAEDRAYARSQMNLYGLAGPHIEWMDRSVDPLKTDGRAKVDRHGEMFRRALHQLPGMKVKKCAHVEDEDCAHCSFNFGHGEMQSSCRYCGLRPLHTHPDVPWWCVQEHERDCTWRTRRKRHEVARRA